MYQSKIVLFACTLFVTMGMFAFVGCDTKRNISALPSENTDYCNDHAAVERAFQDAIVIADQGARYNSSIMAQCAVVTHDSSLPPMHKVVVDFTAKGCSSTDGKYRKGKIIIIWNYKYDDSATIKNVTFDKYYVDGNLLGGKIDFSNQGMDSFKHPIHSIAVQGEYTYANGVSIVDWKSQVTRKWLSGYNTKDVLDDQYSFTGSGTLLRQNTENRVISYSNIVVNYGVPLLMVMNCKWFEQGTVLFKIPNNNNIRTLDWGAGSGSCDNAASINVDNTVFNISF